MSFVGRMAEELARRTSRRESVRRVGAGAFGLVAAWATQGPFGSSVLAEQCTYTELDVECNPPWGRYCTEEGEGGAAANCSGAMCANGCTLDPTFYPDPPKSACWCTATSRDNDGQYYYKCCDCQCSGMVGQPAPDGLDRGCGCRQLVRIPDRNRKRKRRRKKRDGGRQDGGRRDGGRSRPRLDDLPTAQTPPNGRLGDRPRAPWWRFDRGRVPTAT